MIHVLQSPGSRQDREFFYDVADHKIFLAGGIRNCPNWQLDFIRKFSQLVGECEDEVVLVNPRREGDLATNGDDAKAQIMWEREFLQACDNKIFWFPKETVCPITLYELGVYVSRVEDLWECIIGCHADYTQRFDVETQLWLIDHKYQIEHSVEALAFRLCEKLELNNI